MRSISRVEERCADGSKKSRQEQEEKGSGVYKTRAVGEGGRGKGSKLLKNRKKALGISQKGRG